MKWKAIALSAGLLLVASTGCAMLGRSFPVINWDGVCQREVHVKVVSVESLQPVQGATVQWFNDNYEEYLKQPDSVTFGSEQERTEFLDARLQKAMTDSKGECRLRPTFGCGGTSKKYLFWWRRTGRLVISGTIEIQAEGFTPLREPLAAVLGKQEFPMGRKTPIKVDVRIRPLSE